MNITEFAKEYGTSKTTLYRKISAAGLDLEELRGADGQLSDAGMSVLAGLMDGTMIPTKRDTGNAGNSHAVDVPLASEQYASRVRELEQENKELREKVDQLQTVVLELQKQAADKAEAHAAELSAILKREQEHTERLLLTSSTNTKRGVFGALHDFLFGSAKQETENKAE